jgi:hypothetical protein
MLARERARPRGERHPADGTGWRVGGGRCVACPSPESTFTVRSDYDMAMTDSAAAGFAARFDDGPILPVDPDGLEVLHEREYRVRAYRLPADNGGGDRLLLRGAVRDQKPPHLYVAEDPDPITIHHMQVELVVGFPDMTISDATVLFETHPHAECVSIIDAYQGLIGLSITRGFTHRVRELFGGPRGCTHTTALLLAMAPVAVQCIWSMSASNARRTGEPTEFGAQRSSEHRERSWSASLNSCHVWDEHGEFVADLRAGKDVGLPIPMRRRFERLGIEPTAGG